MPAGNEWFSDSMNGNSDTALRKPGLWRGTAQWRNQETVHGHPVLHKTPRTKLNIGDKPHLIFNIDEAELPTRAVVPKTVTQKTAKNMKFTSVGRGENVQVVHLSPPPFVIAKRVEMYKQNLAAGSESAMTIFFLNWFNSFRSTGFKVVLDVHSSRASLMRTNYCKESDIKMLCLPSHTTPAHVSKPFKTNCHHETVNFMHNSANHAFTKFSVEQHFFALLA